MTGRPQGRLTQARRRPRGLTIATPDGWTVTTQPGPDFTVTHLHKLASLGAPPYPAASTSATTPPSSSASPASTRPSSSPAPPGGSTPPPPGRQTWTAGGSRFTTEAMARHPGGSATVHTWGSADTEPELTELRKMIETIQ